MIRLAIVEDEPAMAEGLVALLQDAPDLTVVGTAGDLAGARRLLSTGGLDVVLCDIMFGGSADGLDLLREQRGQSTPAFLMFSARTNPGFYRSALDLGAAGWLSKMAPVDEIAKAVRIVAAGGRVYEDAVLRTARSAMPRPTDRELEIVALMAAGLGNKEIAGRLGIRVKTVESQLRRLFDRYGTSSRTELARRATNEGWIRDEAL